MNNIAVYPGSFDPITMGHLDIIERASHMFDKVHVVISKNNAKNFTFTIEERLEMIRLATSHLSNISIDSFEGLTVDYAVKVGAKAFIRGLRAISDYEYELQLFQFNHHLNPSIETVILFANEAHLFLSSSKVKELAWFQADISRYVPNVILEKVCEKFKK